MGLTPLLRITCDQMWIPVFLSVGGVDTGVVEEVQRRNEPGPLQNVQFLVARFNFSVAAQAFNRTISRVR